jgi:5-formyltetrahydrofolate cyclo-ligase
MRKDQLRRHVRSIRVLENTDEAIERSVCALPEFRDADVVFTYLSFGSEVPTRGIIEAAWKAGKTVALPRCGDRPREMSWHRIRSFAGLERSGIGVEEPANSTETLIDPFHDSKRRAIALVPGLCFDERGFRLGYGGGYYDEFLRDFAGITAGLCREAHMKRSLDDFGALEPHDLPVQIVVTESRTIRLSP